MAAIKPVCLVCDRKVPKALAVISQYSRLLYCAECVIEGMQQCSICGEITFYSETGICKKCIASCVSCETCEARILKNHSISHNDKYYCQNCYRKLFVICLECGQKLTRDEAKQIRNKWYCIEHAPPEYDLRVSRQIQFQIPIIRDKPCTLLGPICFGIELEVVANIFDGGKINQMFPNWGWCRDSSIEFCDDYPFPVEFLSPVLFGDDGLNEVLSFVSYIADNVSTNASTGLHVHVNAKNITPQELARIAYAWKHIEGDIFEAMPRNRRDSRHCQPLQYKIEDLAKVKNNVDLAKIVYNLKEVDEERLYDITRSKYTDVRYRTINLHSYFHKSTLEFRIHQSTLNLEKIERWLEITTRLAYKAKDALYSNRNDVMAFFRPETVMYIEKRKRLFNK